MANTKSAKKAAKQSEVKRKRNLARKTAIKTAIKKVLGAIEDGASYETTQELLQDAAAKLSRAKSKGIIHANTASRKLSRLTLKMNKSSSEK